MPPATSIERITVPVVIVASLLGGCIYLGRVIGKAEDKLDSATRQISKLQGTVDRFVQLAQSGHDDGVRLQGTLNDHEHRLTVVERDLRLLADFTEGRISRLPYRPPGTR